MPLRDRPEPEPGPGEAVVRVRAAGICGSDVHGFTGSTGRRQPGIVMGHELAGTVHALGEGVQKLAVGDRVAVNPLVTCGSCPSCRAGRPNVCQNRLGIGWSVDGGYAELVRAPAGNLVPIPDGLGFELASTAEPLAVALHAANLTPVALGDAAVVLGAGPIGLLCLMALKLKGAGAVAVCDLNPRRLELARTLGADATVNSGQADAVARVRELTGGLGAGAVIEAVGVGATARDSLLMARNGGSVTWVGNAAPNVEIPMQEIVTRELSVRGAYGFNEEFERAVGLLGSGALDPSPLLERLAPLEDGPELVRQLAAGELDDVKVVLRP